MQATTRRTFVIAAAAALLAATAGLAAATAATATAATARATSHLRSAAVTSAGQSTIRMARTACTPTWQVVSSPHLPRRYTSENPVSFVADSDMTADVVSSQDVWFPSDDGGSYTPSQPFILHWDGHSVKETSQPPQPPFGGQEFGAGSFDSATDGWVIGQYSPDIFNPQPDAAHWSHGRWTISPLGFPANPSAGLPFVHAIAALSPGRAWAVGGLLPETLGAQIPTGALIERWDGTQWHIATNPAATTKGARLRAITVVSPADIWAVGQQGSNPAQMAPLIEHYDGTSWHVIPAPPLPASAQPAGLTSISADAPDDIWAAGVQQAPDGNGEPLVEHWNGTAWTVVTGLPQTGTGLAFNAGGSDAVYAASPSDVWVTASNNPNPGAFLHWDGHTWAAIPQPGPREEGLVYQINDIAGSGPSDVWATGFLVSFDGINSGPAVVAPQIYRLGCR